MNFEKVKKVKNSKPVTVLDFIVLAVLLAVAVGVIIWLIFRGTPTTVTVTAQGVYRELPLDENVELELEHLTVHVKDGRVWVTDADCADKTCEHTGEITRVGQRIVCLPNGVTVGISGTSDLQWEVGR